MSKFDDYILKIESGVYLVLGVKGWVIGFFFVDHIETFLAFPKLKHMRWEFKNFIIDGFVLLDGGSKPVHDQNFESWVSKVLVNIYIKVNWN